MAEIMQWEYRVESLGSVWKGARDADIEALLDEWGEEGWEVFSLEKPYGSSQVRIVAKRPLGDNARRYRRWPE